MVAVALVKAAVRQVLRAQEAGLRTAELVLNLRVVRVLLRVVREVVVEADGAFVLVEVVEGRIHAIVGDALMLGQIRAAHARESAGHEAFVFVSADFPLHVVLRLVVAAADPVHALTLT